MNQERNLCLLLITLHYQGWTKLRQWQTQSGWRVTWRNNLEKHAGNFTVKRWSPWRQEPITCENPPIQFDLVPIPKISGWLFSCPWCLSRKSPGFAFYCIILQVKVGILIFIQNEICLLCLDSLWLCRVVAKWSKKAGTYIHPNWKRCWH